MHFGGLQGPIHVYTHSFLGFGYVQAKRPRALWDASMLRALYPVAVRCETAIWTIGFPLSAV